MRICDRSVSDRKSNNSWYWKCKVGGSWDYVTICSFYPEWIKKHFVHTIHLCVIVLSKYSICHQSNCVIHHSSTRFTCTRNKKNEFWTFKWSSFRLSHIHFPWLNCKVIDSSFWYYIDQLFQLWPHIYHALLYFLFFPSPDKEREKEGTSKFNLEFRFPDNSTQAALQFFKS